MPGTVRTQISDTTRRRLEGITGRGRPKRARRRLSRLLLAAILAIGLLYSAVIAPATAAAAPGGGPLDRGGLASGVSHRAAPHAATGIDTRRGDSKVSDDISQFSVVGPDDRTKTITTEFPMSAIAFFEMAFTGFESQCTGTFIGPNVLLTAAHCLYSHEDGWVQQIRVVPGKDGDYEPYGSVYADWFWVPEGWYYGYEGHYDWGLVRLPTSDLGQTVGWFQIGVLSTSTLSAPDFYPVISGYPGDKPYGTQWFGAQPAFDAITGVDLVYTIDTFGGMSGSAVWRAADRLIVGIHVAGYSDTDGAGLYNAARRIDQEVLNSLFNGCVEIGCEFAYAIEGPPASGEHLYSSTFADWGAGSDASGATYHGQDGSYWMEVGPGHGTYTESRTQSAEFADVVASVDVRLTSNTGEATGCLVARVDPAATHDYVLCIDANGNLSAAFEYFDESGYHAVPLLHGQLASDRPAQEWNRLTIVAYGKDFWFYANDVFLGIATHSGPAAGAVGITVINGGDQPAEFAFANLDVWSAN